MSHACVRSLCSLNLTEMYFEESSPQSAVGCSGENVPQESKRFQVWIPMFRVAWLKSARTGGHVRLEECRGRNRVYQWKIRTQRWVREADDIGKHALRTVWDPRALSGYGGQLNYPSTARRVRKKVSSGFKGFLAEIPILLKQ